MAQPVSARMTAIRKHLGMLLALGFVASAALAENLPDPTRPSGASMVNGSAENVPSGPVLQSVLNSSGRKIAIISGQSVKLGEMIGSARVVKIEDAEVVLAKGKDVQVLSLFPVVEKQPVAAYPLPMHGMRQK
jgi:MSHA biogenesis protein MshK